MKYIDEYRDPHLAQGLLARIKKTAGRIKRTVTIMEICGSHTQAIGRFGIRQVLPDNVRLISGPGCPVCVTSAGDVERALWLASYEKAVFATFGDMLRVPGSGGESLQKKRAAGADIRVITSAAECIALAGSMPDREIILMGIGFETTAPTVAAAVASCRRKGIRNLAVFSVHKTVPPVLGALIGDPSLRIDGFICPGHVSTIIGTDAYRIIPESGMAAVIVGFESVDILQGLWMILEQIAGGPREVAIQYGRGVRPEGNPRAKEVMASVFCPANAEWRGIGTIPGSGLALREDYEDFDAAKKYAIPEITPKDPPGCGCGEVLRGLRTPDECMLFGKICTPASPVGPCMVSGEGTCAAYFRYNR